MADISKCGAIRNIEVCPLRNKCYRFTATISGQYQSWMAPEWKDKECENFWDNTGGLRDE